jgi:hypothetical protein
MGAVLVRRASGATLPQFDPALPLLEDWDYWLRLAFRVPFVCAPEIVARITAHGPRRTTGGSAQAAGEAARLIYAKLLDDPAARPVAWRLRRNLTANIHITAGHQYRLAEGNPRSARREFAQAIGIAPLFARGYVGLVEAMLSPRAIHWLRTARSAVYRRGR